MIVTKNWLNEWIDIKEKSSEEICDTLNSIGLEVDSLKKVRVPKRVVVGYVKERKKHPDADKLSVCQVDVGRETLQIVCGAKNVREGQYVPVALVGCELDEGFKIKKTKLRGADSSGMICSSEEIGLPKLNDGILELDDSIGDLKVGKELCEYDLLNDDIIEIELTANRGDCLSIFGIARDLAGAYNKKLFYLEDNTDKYSNLGIGRVLSLTSKNGEYSTLLYEIFKKNSLISPLLLKLRLAWVKRDFENIFELYKNYTIHSTGVILKLYPFEAENDESRCDILLKKDENNIEYVDIENKKSYVGFSEPKELIPNEENDIIILEASYADPYKIAKAGKFLKTENDIVYYHSSRGSEPNLEFGVKVFKNILSKYSDVKWYNKYEIIDNRPSEKKINVEIRKINALIGKDIDKSKIVSKLKGLSFKVDLKDESDLIIQIPLFRHDITNEQDITEEIVRMIGIDNIESKPLKFVESNNQNIALVDYRKKFYYRFRSSSNGFFEVTNYIFTDSSKLSELGFERVVNDKELINPVTNELDTLRTTLVVGLLESASRNVKYGKKSIRLFEIGTVFDKNRNESLRLSFLFSGETQRAALINHGKPKIIDFFTFAQNISSVIGKFEVVKSDNMPKILSMYESGRVIVNKKDIGYIGRVHLDVQDRYDLPKSYLCELDFDKLELKENIVKKFSKFPSVERDFSFLIPKNWDYARIKSIIKSSLPKEVINFFPIDIYKSKELGDKISLTVRFVIQSFEKTLNDDQINEILSNVLEKLHNEGIKLR